MTYVKTVLLILAITALETTAFAQPSAEDLYTEGQTAYDRADFETATAKWQAAYDLSKESGLLFNLAQAQRQFGDCPRALANYRRYIADDEETASEQHRLAEDFERELEPMCGTMPPIVASPKTDQPKNDQPIRLNLANDLTSHKDRRLDRTSKLAGIAIGGAGLALLATGVGLGHHGASIGGEVTAACTASCDWEELKDKDARGRRDVAIGRTLDGLGIAAIAGGAVLYYLGVRQNAVTLAPKGPEGAVVSWSSSW